MIMPSFSMADISLSRAFSEPASFFQHEREAFFPLHRALGGEKLTDFILDLPKNESCSVPIAMY